MLLPLFIVFNKYFGKGYLYFIFLLGSFFAFYLNYKNVLYNQSIEFFLKMTGLVFAVALLGFFQQHPSLTRFDYSVATYANALLPFAVFAILHFYGRLEYEKVAIFIALAAMGSGLFAFYDLYTGLSRYERLHGSPIIFGDLSMLFGLLALTLGLRYKDSKLIWLFLIAGGLGIWASLYSGSRGGWIVLFTLPFFLIFHLPQKYRVKAFLLVLTFLFFMFASVLTIESSVQQRIFSMISEVQLLFSLEDYTGGSLGSRLEFWEVSWLAFLSNPVFGIGVGEFYAFKTHLIEQGIVPIELMKFKHSHNEYMTILSSMGLLGVAVYSFMFVWLWRLFRSFYQQQNLETKLVAMSGMVTILCYVEFSLSESFLSSVLGGAGFYFLMAVFIYYLKKNKIPNQ